MFCNQSLMFISFYFSTQQVVYDGETCHINMIILFQTSIFLRPLIHKKAQHLPIQPSALSKPCRPSFLLLSVVALCSWF